MAANQLLDYPEKIEKKERSASKRREKLSEEDKELKKDRKLNRKRVCEKAGNQIILQLRLLISMIF